MNEKSGIFDIENAIKRVLAPNGVAGCAGFFDVEISAHSTRIAGSTSRHFGSIISFLAKDAGLADMPIAITQVVMENPTELSYVLRRAITELFMRRIYSLFEFSFCPNSSEKVILGKMGTGKELRVDSLLLWLSLVAEPFIQKGNQFYVSEDMGLSSLVIDGLTLVFYIPAYAGVGRCESVAWAHNQQSPSFNFQINEALNILFLPKQ
jgi:hypothetical protein